MKTTSTAERKEREFLALYNAADPATRLSVDCMLLAYTEQQGGNCISLANRINSTYNGKDSKQALRKLEAFLLDAEKTGDKRNANLIQKASARIAQLVPCNN